MSGFIVSGNYLERDSRFRWLIRKSEELSDHAVACRAIALTNVSMRPSNEIEYGFGCQVVAAAELATPAIATLSRPNDATRLFFKETFSSPGFRDGNDVLIHSFDRMWLLSDGSVWGYPTKSADTAKATQKATEDVPAAAGSTS